MRIDFSQFRLIGIRSLTIPANIGVCGEPVKELGVFGTCREKNCVIRHQEGLNCQFEPCTERAHWRISWMAS